MVNADKSRQILRPCANIRNKINQQNPKRIIVSPIQNDKGDTMGRLPFFVFFTFHSSFEPHPIYNSESILYNEQFVF